jgi:H+/Cl- antiporter ClcA
VRALPLQLVDAPQPPEWALAFGQLIGLLSGIIGLFIAYQAYRGYRRNDSRPMLYLAVGFALTLGIPFALLPVYLTVPSTVRAGVFILQQCSQLTGLLTILYALRMEP